MASTSLMRSEANAWFTSIVSNCSPTTHVAPVISRTSVNFKSTTPLDQQLTDTMLPLGRPLAHVIPQVPGQILRESCATLTQTRAGQPALAHRTTYCSAC